MSEAKKPIPKPPTNDDIRRYRLANGLPLDNEDDDVPRVTVKTWQEIIRRYKAPSSDE